MHRIALPSLLVAVSALLAALAVPPLPAVQEGAELDGKQIFESSNCNLCHAVSTAGIEAKTTSERMKGPDLVDLAEQRDAETVLDYLRKSAEIDGEEHKVAFKGSDEELGALVAWLMDQKTE